MKQIEKLKDWFDSFQQKHAVLGFPIAVVKRYGDDKVGKQAALITYYGFLALFPLILAFISIVSIIARNDPQLQAEITNQVFQYFPMLGEDLQKSFHALRASGWVLIVEILILIYGARGVAVTLQDAFNYVWHADKDLKPNLFFDNLRSFAIIVAAGVGILINTAITFALNVVLHIGTDGTFIALLANTMLSVLLFLVVFRLGTTSRVKTHDLILGAVITAVGVLIIQHLGAVIMGQQLPKLEGAYGSFALTLGMLFWIFLQAQLVMYALVITAVRTQKDWPRKLFDE